MYLHRQGWFRDDDYVEIFAELMAADAALKQFSERMKNDAREIWNAAKQKELLENRIAGLENDLFALRHAISELLSVHDATR